MAEEGSAGAVQEVPAQVSPLEAQCNTMRGELLTIEQRVRRLVGDPLHGEAAAQAMLAVRHLEDARMRIGKVIQHTAGLGVSCWDDKSRKPADDGR